MSKSTISGKTLLWIATAILAVVAGVTTYFNLQKEDAQLQATAAKHTPGASGKTASDEPLPPYQLQDIDGTAREITEWKGKVVVLNFWATWCPPCRRELPTFKALQDEYGERGVQFVGISLDRAELVRDYARIEDLNYPQLVGPSKALKLGQQLGNQVGALPFTVVVNREGVIKKRIFGEWSREEAEAVFSELL